MSMTTLANSLLLVGLVVVALTAGRALSHQPLRYTLASASGFALAGAGLLMHGEVAGAVLLGTAIGLPLVSLDPKAERLSQ